MFGKQPQRFLLTSEVKCLQFHGTTVAKPIPDYRIFKGTVFELVDQALGFVMAKIAASVGTRAESSQAPVTYEFPRAAVAEAIVNAVAHRDYASNASVQVMLFADRLEVWNPGELPPSLTPASLRLPHASIPRNPLLAEPLFLTRHIEKAGTGILDMIGLCKAAKLRPPEFRQERGQFIQTLWRPKVASGAHDEAHDEAHDGAHDEAHDAITATVAATEQRILEACRSAPQSTPELLAALEYATRTGNFKRGLKRLLSLGLLELSIPEKPRSKHQKYRITGMGTHYVLGKGAAKRLNGPRRVDAGKRAAKVPIVPSAGPEESAINRTNRTSQATEDGSQTAHTAQPPSPESRPESESTNRASVSKRKSKGSSK